MAFSVEIPGDPPQLLSSSSPFRGVFDFYHLTVPRQAGNDRGVKPNCRVGSGCALSCVACQANAATSAGADPNAGAGGFCGRSIITTGIRWARAAMSFATVSLPPAFLVTRWVIL
jgi:hypothetical protein